MKWWRTDTGFPRHQYTAAAIVRFERDELGNAMNISGEILSQLEHIPGSDLIWVCRHHRDACRYGTPELIAIEHCTVMGDDGDGGTLLWVHRVQVP